MHSPDSAASEKEETQTFELRIEPKKKKNIKVRKEIQEKTQKLMMKFYMWSTN